MINVFFKWITKMTYRYIINQMLRENEGRELFKEVVTRREIVYRKS